MRYFIGLLLTFGLIILLFILLLSGGGNHKKAVAPKTLISYASTDAVARETIDGPINANQIHEQIQITVGRDAVVYKEMRGYEGHVVNQKTYPNNQNAYSAFLHALSVAGFTVGNKDPSLSDNVGYCAEGDGYVYELQQNGSDILRFWTNTCGAPKTYNGNFGLTQQLFQDQVPDYDDLTQNMQF